MTTARPAPTASTAVRRPRSAPRGWPALTTVSAAFVAVAPLVLWVAQTAEPGRTLHQTALFAHLAALVVGFGSVLAVDWVALLWMLRRRPFADVLATASMVTVPIWAGYGGLVLTGLLLEPDTADPVTAMKLGLVLIIGLNGLLATRLHQLLRLGGSRKVLVAGAASATASQVCWWGATLIGFLNAH